MLLTKEEAAVSTEASVHLYCFILSSVWRVASCNNFTKQSVANRKYYIRDAVFLNYDVSRKNCKFSLT